MSGWASAALDINAPAPMVAASAAAILAIAILNDINLSTVIGDPFGGREILPQTCKTSVWRRFARPHFDGPR
jgi:hypothetical protein